MKLLTVLPTLLAVTRIFASAAEAEVPATTGLRNANTRKDARRTNGYWIAPTSNVGLTCIDNSIRAGGGKPAEICMTEGEALCVQYDFKPMGGRWQFGIKDSKLRLYNPKGQVAWEYSTDVSHVCIGEDRELVPDRYSKERPYLTFYNEKTHTVVGSLTCDGTDGEDDKNIGQSTMLKLTDQADAGPYADYPLTIVKFKKGQTENPDHDNSLWDITVREPLSTESTSLDLESFLNYNADKCEWSYPFVASFEDLQRQIADATDPANRAKIEISDDRPIVFESVIDFSNKYFVVSCLGSDCVFDLNGYSFVTLPTGSRFYAEFESITIENGSSTKGRVSAPFFFGYGGAFLLRGIYPPRPRLSMLVLTKCIVRSNAATVDSGAVDNQGARVIATDTIFTDNKAMRGNGGVMYSQEGISTFTHCRFERNSASNAGRTGGAFVLFDTTAFENCDFIENIAGASGGAIVLLSTDSKSIKNCRFIKNSAAGFNGGAINVLSTTLSLEDSQFISNTAKQIGGAIHLTASAATEMTNCRFEANAAAQGGAAYIQQTSSLTAVDCNFTENMATEGAGLGGALSTYGASTLEDCLFEGNIAHNGGAVFSSTAGNSAGTIISGAKTVFKCNVASFRGGAVLHLREKLSISDAEIKANSAAAFGGGIALGVDSIASIDNCRLEQNVVGRESRPTGGGAIAFPGILTSFSSLTVNNTVFQDNIITVAGLSSKDIYGNRPSTNTFECGEGFGNCFCDARLTSAGVPIITTNDLTTVCAGAGVGQSCQGCTSSFVPVMCPEPAATSESNNMVSTRTGVDTPLDDMDMWDMLEQIGDEEGDDGGDYVEAIIAQYEERLKQMNMSMPGGLTEAPTQAPSTAAGPL